MARWFALLVTALAVLLPLPAHAKEPSAADKETARTLMDVGDDKLAQGDVEGALEAYEGADKLMGVPTTGVAVGKARMQLGKLVEARDVLLRVARYPAAPNEPEVFRQARSEAERLASELGARIPTLTIAVIGVKPGDRVEVAVDGVPIAPATLGLPRRVDPGSRSIVAEGPGYRPAKAVIAIEEGETKRVELKLERDPDYVPPRSPAPAPTGPDAAERSGPRISPLVWAGSAVALAGLIAGAVTGGIAYGNANGLEDNCIAGVCSIEYENDIRTTRALAHASTASFAVAGVGGVLLVVGLIVSDWGGAEQASARLGANGIEVTF